jgi:hypothetical protein
MMVAGLAAAPDMNLCVPDMNLCVDDQHGRRMLHTQMRQSSANLRRVRAIDAAAQPRACRSSGSHGRRRGSAAGRARKTPRANARKVEAVPSSGSKNAE